jgi:hypothetical protein
MLLFLWALMALVVYHTCFAVFCRDRIVSHRQVIQQTPWGAKIIVSHG